MLFLYSSKRRHVESLLNCSANRWKFSRCLYEINWNIPIKKTFPCIPSHSTVSLSLSLHLCLFYFLFFFWLASGLGKGTLLLLKVKWKVDRFLLPITTSPGKLASTKCVSEFRANQQTGPVSATLQASKAISGFSSAGWTCLTLTQVDVCQVPSSMAFNRGLTKQIHRADSEALQYVIHQDTMRLFRLRFAWSGCLMAIKHG